MSKKVRTFTKFGIIPAQQKGNVTVVAFADGSHSTVTSQPCYIIVLLICEMKKGIPFHILRWSSHFSRRSAKFTSAAEIFAAGEAVDEAIILEEVMTTVIKS